MIRIYQKLKQTIQPLEKALILVLVLAILLELGVLFQDHFDLKLSDNKQSILSLNSYADTILASCKDASYRPGCYDKEIPKLMAAISMEEAFEVTKIVQDKDSQYVYCHVLGHELSAREVSKDPDKWKDVVTRIPSGICSNGGIHGAFQERFRTESMTPEQIVKIKPELLNICESRGSWFPTGLEQASCYHALGHLTMYITLADINLAVSLCDELSIKSDGRNFQQVCYDGSFMQIFQPLEPEDFSLLVGKEIKKDQLLSFCKKFSGIVRGSCWSEGWPLFYAEIMTPQGLNAHCQNNLLQTPQIHDRCFTALFYVVAAQLKLDSQALAEYCKGIVGERQTQCYSNFASRLIETDYRNIGKAVSLCSTAAESQRSGCYDELVFYSTYNFHAGSQESLELCNSLPEPWKNKCLNRS